MTSENRSNFTNEALFGELLEKHELEKCRNLIAHSDRNSEIKMQMVEIVTYYSKKNYLKVLQIAENLTNFEKLQCTEFLIQFHPNNCDIPGAKYVQQCILNSLKELSRTKIFERKEKEVITNRGDNFPAQHKNQEQNNFEDKINSNKQDINKIFTRNENVFELQKPINGKDSGNFEQLLQNHEFEKCREALDKINDNYYPIKTQMIQIVECYTQKKFLEVLNFADNENYTSFQKQFRKLATKFHPDKCRTPGTSYVFQCIQDSFENLKQLDNSNQMENFVDSDWKEFDDDLVQKQTQKEENQDDEDQQYLKSLCLQQLKKVVQKRQRQIFYPDEDNEENVGTRTKKLKVAKKFLARSIQNQEKQQEVSCGGYFVDAQI
eukprot:TRINITY_DN27680_c0_g2_i1.p1 TRINITY_DN27680_c0_g2~~TRINITY_DN27680_c0_g2_i1.p1  ORF type:complete len:378 (-),score=45.18 TRINITY_DN27680_c0_g2_i1:303-1436(-)